MFKISDDISWKIIQPEGSMTEETAEDFRIILLDLLKSNHNNIRFDLSDVHEMDAVILSIFALFSGMIKEKIPDFNAEIINAADDIANVFKMTHLDRTYKIL